MKISPLIFMESISVEDYDIFYGIPWKFPHRFFHRIPWKGSLQFHRNYAIDYSMDLQGVSWNLPELDIRITNEYRKDFCPLQFI